MGVGTPVNKRFRSSIPGLRVPLSTLHPHPYGCWRMTRGQGGSLILSCAALSSATPGRFIPALSWLRFFKSSQLSDLVSIIADAPSTREPGAPTGDRSGPVSQMFRPAGARYFQLD